MKRSLTLFMFILALMLPVICITGCSSPSDTKEEDAKAIAGDIIAGTIDSYSIVIEDFPAKVAAVTPENKAELQEEGNDIMDSLNEFEEYLSTTC